MLTIRVFDIKYDIDDDTVNSILEDEGIDEPTELEVENKRTEILKRLPKEFYFSLSEFEDIEDCVNDKIDELTNWLNNGWSYELC